MEKNTTRKVAAGAVAAIAVAGGGVAIGATQIGSPKEESQAVVADAAKQLGIEPSKLSAALEQALEDRVDAAVASGAITKAEGDRAKAMIESGALPLFFAGGHHGPGGLRLPPSRGRSRGSCRLPRDHRGAAPDRARIGKDPGADRDRARKDRGRPRPGALRRQEEGSRRRRGRRQADQGAGGRDAQRPEDASHRPRQRDAAALRPRPRRNAGLPWLPRLSARDVQGADRVTLWSRGSNPPAVARGLPSGH